MRLVLQYGYDAQERTVRPLAPAAPLLCAFWETAFVFPPAAPERGVRQSTYRFCGTARCAAGLSWPRPIAWLGGRPVGRGDGQTLWSTPIHPCRGCLGTTGRLVQRRSHLGPEHGHVSSRSICGCAVWSARPTLTPRHVGIQAYRPQISLTSAPAWANQCTYRTAFISSPPQLVELM